LIPQAFTTRDMSEAYKWLNTLPPNVRDEMKSMEQVVMLYIKAKRLGGGVPSKEDIDSFRSQTQTTQAPDASKSSQEFQKTLKTLKTELDRFDFQPQSQPTLSQEASKMLEPHPVQPSAPQTYQPAQAVHQEAEQPHTSHNILSALRMDPRSRQIVNEIREGLNLGSDNEVLRMSLVLAHKTLRDLLK
jgi:hypothetical protein